MQIVIDIPQNVYNTLQQFPDDQLHIENAIKYGVPFNSVIENIKAEIEEKRTNILYCVQDFTPNDVLDIIDDINEIIDKHTSGDMRGDTE